MIQNHSHTNLPTWTSMSLLVTLREQYEWFWLLSMAIPLGNRNVWTQTLLLCGGVECLCQCRCTWRGQVIQEQIIQSSYESVTFVGNSLVDMSTKCGSMEDASRLFNKIPSHNVVTLNAMLLVLGSAHWNYSNKCNRRMFDRTLLLSWGCWMHVPV
jgi:hypothetical protein